MSLWFIDFKERFYLILVLSITSSFYITVFLLISGKGFIFDPSFNHHFKLLHNPDFYLFQGKVLFDPSFNHHFKLLHNPGIIEGIAKLCNVCKEITAKTDLVKNGSAQCFSSTSKYPKMQYAPHPIQTIFWN